MAFMSMITVCKHNCKWSSCQVAVTQLNPLMHTYMNTDDCGAYVNN